MKSISILSKVRRATCPTLNETTRLLSSLVLVAAALLPSSAEAAGQTPVDLGTAGRFAVLAATEITSVPTAAVKGDVGLSPAARSKIAGLTAPEVVGTIYAADDNGAVAAMLIQAKGDLNVAFLNAGPAGRPGGKDVSAFGGGAGELGGRTLAPGLYKSASGSYDITSLDLTLDAGGDPNAVWIFQTATTLHMLPDRKVIFAGGAQARNVFWQIGTSATLSTHSVCKGTIMAAQSIALQTGAVLEGRALVQNGAVTLDSDTITNPALRPSPPRFGPVHRAVDSAVTLVITNTPGVALTVQGSINLTTWTTLATPTPSASPFSFTDNTASALPKRFYRAFYP